MRYIWAERSVYAAVRGDDAGGGCVCSAGADSRMGVFSAMLLLEDAGGYVLVAVVSFAAGGGRYRVLHTIEKKQ